MNIDQPPKIRELLRRCRAIYPRDKIRCLEKGRYELRAPDGFRVIFSVADLKRTIELAEEAAP